ELQLNLLLLERRAMSLRHNQVALCWLWIFIKVKKTFGRIIRSPAPVSRRRLSTAAVVRVSARGPPESQGPGVTSARHTELRVIWSLAVEDPSV
ncbi:unnamed protein product, partial [Gadus morhua 'NCC']